MRRFRCALTLSGTWSRRAQPSPRLAEHRRITLALEFDGRSPREMNVRGTIDADGLATVVPAIGRFGIGRELALDLTFVGDGGEDHRLIVRRALRLGELRRNLTELPARIQNGGGHDFAECLLRFDARADLVDFVSSLRFAE